MLLWYNKERVKNGGVFYRDNNCIRERLRVRKQNLENFGITVYRGTKSVWRKYHFLVPPKVMKKNLLYLWSILRERRKPSIRGLLFYDPMQKYDYNDWVNWNEKVGEYEKMSYEPLISFVIPVYNVEEKYLQECIDSILNQSYQNFEICIVDDASTKEETLEVLEKYKDNKKIHIKHRKKNGHISVASNDALEMAKGEYVALMDDDDTLAPDALAEVVKALNKDKKIDMIYTDEDKIDLDGDRCDPNFKPDFSPDTLLSVNYMSHLGVLRKSIIDEIGGFRKGYEGAQDYDLYLRFTEKAKKIHHIPKVLYHWRMIPGSTSMTIDNKDYASDNGKKAIESALKRRKINAHVVKDEKSKYYQVIYDFKEQPLVSILIPTKDHARVTGACLKSIYGKTTYKNFEIILIDNGSSEQETLKLFNEYKSKHDNFRVLREDIEFNYSRLNNLAAKEAKGEYLVLLNNDTEVITPEWLEYMVGYAMQPHVGAVGVKLLYPDETVQHAGVILGLGGVASHAYIGSERNDMGIYGRLRVPYDYAAVTGACLMVSKEKFKKVGGLEEDLKVAYNDIDFCLKLLDKGYYNVLLPMVELYHHESKSRGSDLDADKIDRFNSEQDYMWEKWGDVLVEDRFYNVNYTNRMWFMLDRESRKDYDRRKK
ncbi:glycosyltransferase family 2 protein [Candidatus Saccharibacteria bacterium]|nr:glycosyltransferase family 2 protein [Candidatus Saccharibacteria bacterium]